MTAPFTVLSAPAPAARPVTPAELEEACKRVAEMSTPDFVAACATVGRQVHLDPDGFADFLAGKLT